MTFKKCLLCNSDKAIDFFYKKSNGLYGVDSKCKQCVLNLKKKYYKKRLRAKSGQIELIDDYDLRLSEEVVSLFVKYLKRL
jgi:hypothetical protein